MRWLVRIGLWLVCSCLMLLAVGQRFGNPGLSPRAGEPTITLQVVDYGYHAGLYLPREALRQAALEQGASRLAAVTERFAAYPTLEFGWGDEAFYRSVPTIDALPLGLAVKAGLGLDSGTVLLVVGYQTPVELPYPGAARAMITLSARAFDRMIPLLEATLAGDTKPEDLGTGLYGPSLFYRANGHYSLLNVCNHWIARLFVAAGRSVNLALATSSDLLIWQLR